MSKVMPPAVYSVAGREHGKRKQISNQGTDDCLAVTIGKFL